MPPPDNFIVTNRIRVPRLWYQYGLDAALVVTAILMLVTNQLILFFHVMFLLLTAGAFYWHFRQFTTRSLVWVTVTTAVLLSSVAVGRTHFEELLEIPLLTSMLVLVFIIARRRAIAEDALREANEILESRVASRTEELTREVHQRRETEQTLRESEERYRRLVELSFETVVIHADNTIVSINSHGVELIGAQSPAQLIGRPILDFIHPDFVDTVQARVEQQFGGEQGVPLIEEKMLRLDGSTIDVEVVAVPIKYKGGPAIQTVIRDISTRKQAEVEREQLLATEREHRLLAETLGEVFLALAAQTSHETVLDEILRQVRRIVSYSAANIMLLHSDEKLVMAHHQGYSTFGSRELMSQLEQTLSDLPLDADVVKTRQPLVVPDTHQNPQWVVASSLDWIRSFIAVPICLGERVLGLLRLDSNEPGRFSLADAQRLQPLAHAAAISLENTRLYDQARQEIAERIQVEEALREIAAKNQAILNAISDSIFYMDSHGQVLDYKIQEDNSSAWMKNIVSGWQTIDQVFPPDMAELMLQYVAIALQTGKIQMFEFEMPDDARTIYLENRLMATGSNEVLVVVSDITDLKAHQAALEKERARIARDLHDSLGQSLGYLRLKLDEFSMEDAPYTLSQIRGQLARMRDVSNESYELVRSMLAAARPSNSAALNATLQAQARSVGNRARFKVEFKSTGRPQVLSPVVQQQVLYICQEALNNIEKHAGAKTVSINMAWTDTDLTIKLVDDGCGFKTDVAVEAGHYGLSIMHERANEINGGLSVVSSPNNGTELVLYLPLAAQPAPMAL